MVEIVDGEKAIEQVYAEAISGARIDFGQSMAPQIYALLRNAIIQNRLVPGTPIYEARFAEIIGVSRTPLRAAMQQLSKEGLVATRPQVGSIVAPIEQQKILSAVFCRSALETAVVRRLAEMKPVETHRLAQVLALQAECTARDDYIAFFEFDEQFHALLAEMAGVPEAWQLVLSSKTHVDRARLRLQSSIPGRAAIAYREHLTILDAIKAGDAELAVQSMDKHVRSALDIIQTAPGERS